MPTYEYRCRECGISFERFQHFSEEPVRDCPECGGPVQRVIQPVGIIFKGKGFYVTDHKGSASSTAPKPQADVAETLADKASAAAPEAKPETSTKSATPNQHKAD